MKHLHRFVFLTFVCSLMIFCVSYVLGSDASAIKERKRLKPGDLKPLFGTAVKRGVSIPARDIQPRVQGKVVEKKKEVHNRLRRPLPPGLPIENPGFLDSALQSAMPFGGLPGPIVTFDGIQNSDNSSEFGFIFNPPDTCGDVGPNHYVQMVNTLFEVFNKSGTSLLGPMPLSDLFTSVGAPCSNTDDGDPIVLYDPLADRWLLSQFVVAEPSHQCIAISQTSNPTGAYFVYDFQHPLNKFGDYPKLGVWPDAYYMMVNQFNLPSTFRGVGVFAFERDQMLLGNNADFVYFDLESNPALFGILPADVDGPAPPAGTPAYFANYNADEFGAIDSVELFEFDVNFANPGLSTFIERADSPVAVAAFNPILCNFDRNCIPMMGGESVDSLMSMLMHRMQYRNFGTHESLITNHSVDANGSDRAGVRYYELRRSLPGGNFTVNEQATYSPDSTHRWMGSAAMDKNGNLAVGFSASSSSMFPEIRYAGRLASDPSGGLFQGEATMFTSGGAQTNGFNRWGDYTALSVDPTDDCTFWYTNEYYESGSNFVWKTRIGNFKFADCTSCPSIQISPSSLPDSVLNTAYNQTLTASGGASPYTFNVSSGTLPNGITLSPAGVLSGTPTVTGTFNFTVTATDDDGCTGLRTYNLHINFTVCLYCDDFEDGVIDVNWTYVKPLFTEDGDSLIGTPTGKKAEAIATPVFAAGCSTCEVRAIMRTAGGPFNKVWLLGWYVDKNNRVELLMKEENDRWILKQRINKTVVAKNKAILTILPNTDYTARVTFNGTQFEVFIDGVSVFTLTAVGTPSGTVGLKVKSTTATFGEIFVN